jgi:hypothetical protein
VTVAVDDALPSLVVETWAVLLTRPHVAGVVGELSVTVFVVSVDLIVPKLHVSTPPSMAHAPESAPPSVQLVPAFVGSVSVTVADVTSPAPLFHTSIVKPIWLPAVTGPAGFAVFFRLIVPQLTTIEAPSELSPRFVPSFVADTHAVLFSVPQFDAVVGPETCTVLTVPLVRFPQLHVNTPPEIEQSLESSAQVIPPGSVSVVTTFVAVPGPSFVVVMVKLAVSPALMLSSAAVLSTRTFGHCTTIDAESVLSEELFARSFVADTVAVFGSVPQSAASVTPEITTLRTEPLVRLPKLQLSAPLEIEQSFELSLHATPDGSGVSLTVTEVAVPGPSLVTVIVKLAVSPAVIGELSAVLSILTLGFTTVKHSVPLLVCEPSGAV